MQLSARNVLPGIIRKIAPGAVNAEVIIEIAPSLHRSRSYQSSHSMQSRP